MADLRYKVVVDDAEARKKIADLLKGTGVSSEFGGMADDAKKATASVDQLRAAQLANIEALRKAREEQAAHKKAQADLNAAFTQGKIDAQQFRLEQAKLTAEEKERAKSARELKKALAENSEYAKLTKALNNVRKETKDVLAEMFSLERRGYASGAAYEALRKKSQELTKQTQYLDNAVKKIDTTVGQHQRNVGNYSSALDNTIPILGRVNAQLVAMGTSLEELSSGGGFKGLLASITNLGKGLLTFITTPVGAAITALASLFALFQANKQTVIEFDSGMKNVSKTTGMAGKELSAFGDAIVRLSRDLQVVDASKLLEYATVAGQLGVKGRDNIIAFTEALAMLETASDISGEEGGASIARMLTLVDGGVQNVREFGDEIVNLGNNFAATEKEILDNATQISQNVGIYKIARQEVLAFATATKAVGLEAELVGSTFSRTLGEFEKTLRTGRGVADLLKVIGGSQDELQRKFRQDAAGVFVDYVRGLNNIDKAGGSVNEALEATGIVAVRDQRVIASLATNGFDVLTNALDKVKSASGAMQAEFENGSNKLENQAKRVGIAWDNLVLTIENGEGAVSKSIISITGYFANLIEVINDTAQSSSWLSTIWGAIDIGGTVGGLVGRAFVEKKRPKKATPYSINDNNMGFDSVIPADEYSIYSKKVAKANAANEAFQRSLVKNKAYWEGERDRVRAVIDNMTDAEVGSKKWLELQKELEAANSKVDLYSSSKKAKDAQRSEARTAENKRQAMERQRTLQNEIDENHARISRNFISREQQEIEAIADKYNALREKARKFSEDPKNKVDGKQLQVDLGKLVSDERFEKKELQTRQATTQLVKELNIQRDLYNEYNNAVEQNGEESARRMFGKQAEFAAQYRAELEKEYRAITALQTTASIMPFGGSNGKLTQAEEERAKTLREMLDALDREDEAKQRARLASALKAVESFGEQELRLRKKYADQIKELGNDITDEQRKVLEQGLKEDLATLIENSPKFKEAMKSIDDSSQALLVNAFKTGKETVFKLIDGMENATASQKAELKKMFGKFFNEGIEAAVEKNFELIINSANAFESIASSLVDFSKNIGNGIEPIKNLLNVAGQLSTQLGKHFNSDLLKGLGKGFGIVGIGVGIGSIFNELQQQANKKLFDQMQYANERQLKMTETVTIAIQQQVDLLNEIYGAERLAKYAQSQKEIEQNWKDINNQLDGKFKMTGDTFADDVLTKINMGFSRNDLTRGMAPGSTKYMKTMQIWVDAMQGRFEKFGKLPDDIEKAREELARLQLQINKGNADDTTKELYNQLQAQMDLYNEVTNKLKEENTGTAFSSLLSQVSDLFFNGGENAADAWSKGFDKILDDYMVQKFGRDFLQERMQGWYEMMSGFAESGNGIDDTEREKLKAAFEKIKVDGESVMDTIREAMGLGKGSDTSNIKAESGIERITRQDGSELVGLFRSTYDVTKQHLLATKENGKIEASLLSIANSKLVALNQIQVNTARTVERLDAAVNHLYNIDKSLGQRGV
ncbi:phage tail tape measure protein [Sphingobacterium kyonggiense]